MCEHREIQEMERTIYNVSPLATLAPHSYYKTLKNRVAAWVRLTSDMSKTQFHDIIYPLKLTEEQREHLWLIISYCHYHLVSPAVFFEFLMEVSIEERASLHSYASAASLREWQKNPIPQKFQDNFLLFLYLAIRDGSRAFSFLEHLEIL